VCRFLGNLIDSHEIYLLPPEPPYRMKLKKNMTVDNQNIGVLQFIAPRPGAMWPLSKDAQFLIVQGRPDCPNQIFRSLVIGGLPLEVLKHSIATCQREHGDCCSPKSPNILRNLKVFDCETHEVVPAPSHCRYVALSYVWGSRTSDSSVNPTSALDALPKTIADSCVIAQSLGYKYMWVDRYVSICKD
jgi:hypothetical protein